MTLLQYEVLIRIDLVAQTLNKNFSTFLFEDTHPKTTTEKEKHLTISGEIMAWLIQTSKTPKDGYHIVSVFNSLT